MASVQLWSAQLSNNDFPPVCALTGRPAEAWRRFKFATPPAWAYALLILVCLGGIGIIAFAVVMALVAQRASGYLPLTRDSVRTVNLAVWIPAGLLITWLACWLVALVIGVTGGSDAGGAVTLFVILGVFVLFLGLLGRLVVSPLLSPRARVAEQAPGQYDRVVELRNVHPMFVAAVQHQQQTRAMQANPPPPPPPPSPLLST